MRQIKWSDLKKQGLARVSRDLPLEIVADGEVVARLIPADQAPPAPAPQIRAQIGTLAKGTHLGTLAKLVSAIPVDDLDPKRHKPGQLVRLPNGGIIAAPERWFPTHTPRHS